MHCVGMRCSRETCLSSWLAWLATEEQGEGVEGKKKKKKKKKVGWLVGWLVGYCTVTVTVTVTVDVDVDQPHPLHTFPLELRRIPSSPLHMLAACLHTVCVRWVSGMGCRRFVFDVYILMSARLGIPFLLILSSA